MDSRRACVILVHFLMLVILWARCHAQNPPRPKPRFWGLNPDLNERATRFLNWLILGCSVSRSGEDCHQTFPQYRHVEYPTYDGFFNNLAKPTQGGIDTPLLRLLPPAYEDGVYKPAKRKANPIDVSEAVMKGPNGMTSKVGNTAFLLFFGQQVVEEILDAQGAACPPEYFNIDIPNGHEYRTRNPKVPVLPLLRTRYDMRTGYSPNNPRQQLNEITPYIDGGLVYGPGKGWADVLRIRADGNLEPDGKLAHHLKLGPGFPGENSHRMPFANPPAPTNHSQYVERDYTADVDRFLKLGNPRGNENPFLLTFGIFWFRWHNTIATFLRQNYPAWDGERIFNEARKWVIATQQSVTVYDWLPKFLKTNVKNYYTTTDDGRETGGYNPAIDPQISHVFQSAAMRFGHTLVPSGVYLRKKSSERCETTSFAFDFHNHRAGRQMKGVRTCNSFWRSPELFTSNKNNFEYFIMGMSSQSTEREDNIIVEDLRGRVFGPLEFSRRDLMAVNIQRGRDHGLPDYNTARKYFGLETVNDLSPAEFKSKTNSPVLNDVIEKLAEVYENDSTQVDIWPGGLLETNRGPGQLFSAIIKEQFERIRDGDRFWFENKENKLFTSDEIERIRSIKIIDFVLSVANITLGDIQEDPFTAPTSDNINGCSSYLTNEVNCDIYYPHRSSWLNHTCKYLPPLNNTNLEPCTRPETYDYFTGSIISFILTFLAIGILTVGILMWLNVWIFLRQREPKDTLMSSILLKEGEFKCKERVSFLERRIVIMAFDYSKMQIIVKSNGGKVLRVLELANLDRIVIFHSENYKHMIIRAENHYDLFLVINEPSYAMQMVQKLSNFCQSIGKEIPYIQRSRYQMSHEVITFKDREEQLKEMLQSVLGAEQEDVDPRNIKIRGDNQKLSSINLTKSELASALGMTVDSAFFKQFFNLMDQNQDGFIGFQEFLHVMLMFSNGSDEQKAQLFFNIYDMDHSGTLSAKDFKLFIESSYGTEVKDQTTEQIVNALMEAVGLQQGVTINFEQFYEIYKNSSIFKQLHLSPTSERKGRESRFSIYVTPSSEANDEEEILKDTKTENVEQTGPFNHFLKNYVRGKEKLLFWGYIYTIVMFLIFAERAYYYSVEREHAGLRRIAGYGVTVTRGAASAIMFTYSSLLVTMTRNILSYFRSTFLFKYFPFDEMIELHKYIGWWALFWTVIHVIGHAINFYHISTQTPPDLLCLFRNFFRSTHVLPKFHYWCWETVTGLTGVFLTLQVVIIYIFAAQGRRYLYKMFWLTHNTYPFLYFLLILHGSGQLVQPPFFYFFFLGPCILFILDKIVSLSRTNIKIKVIGARHLPSDVTLLRIKRPNNFSYQSGQWIRIASLGINNQEFHPFTISSAPHEKDLTVHIRSVGPWTKAVRKVYPDYESIKGIRFQYPEVFIDGPFGEGHQMWWDYEVVVFVGGGIGVTPFASILKDIAFKSNQPLVTFKCKKVIFLWVTRSQKQFEWMTDVLRQVEEADVRNIIRNHIFITQFRGKYDFRTTMLYHAERYFQKISGRSVITGLKAITHFSRPDFAEVFKEIKRRYFKVPIVGVFTCSGLSLSLSVDAGVRAVNRGANSPIFTHYYENF